MTMALSTAAKSGKQGASADLLLASLLPYAYQQEIGPKFKARVPAGVCRLAPCVLRRPACPLLSTCALCCTGSEFRKLNADSLVPLSSQAELDALVAQMKLLEGRLAQLQEERPRCGA